MILVLVLRFVHLPLFNRFQLVAGSNIHVIGTTYTSC
jgi:hypothetical protein